MKQWELFGITDSVPSWTPTPKPGRPATQQADEAAVVVDPFPSLMWTTDAMLRFTSFPAVEDLGVTAPAVDLLELFGLDGEGEDILSAHVEALSGDAATFELEHEGRDILCWVSPVRARDGQVSGTICVGLDLAADRSAAPAEA